MRRTCHRRSVGSRLLPWGLLAFAVSGCASEQDSIDKQLKKLHDDVTRLQAENDRISERMDAVEVREAPAAEPDQRLASAENSNLARPKLKVVRMEPEGDSAVADTGEAADAEHGPRVLIKGEGKELESRTVPGTPKPAPKPASPPAATPK